MFVQVGSRELSFLGAKVPTGNFRSEERKYRGAKSPDALYSTQYKKLHDIDENAPTRTLRHGKHNCCCQNAKTGV